MSESTVVKISALTTGGACIGKITAGEDSRIGKKAFVRYVIPGEVVEIQVDQEKDRFLEGTLLKVLELSPDRREPPCPYFGECGGCDLQHMSIAAQRAAKRQMVEETFQIHLRTLPVRGVELVADTSAEFGYRRRITLHLDLQGALGFFRAGSGDVVDVRECLIASPRINTQLGRARLIASKICSHVAAVVLEEYATGVCAILKLREGKKLPPQEMIEQLIAAFGTLRITERERELFSHFDSETLSAEEFQSLSHFSQVNEEGNECLRTIVLGSINEDAVIEFYAGSGNFTLPLARAGKVVNAIEVHPALVALGEARAAAEGVSDRITFHQKSAEQYLKQGTPVRAAIVLDPPRSGAKEVVRSLSPEIHPEVVYVSCSLPTLVRDLKVLKDRGYQIEHCSVIDMFSQTHHVETVTVLRPVRSGCRLPAGSNI